MSDQKLQEEGISIHEEAIQLLKQISENWRGVNEVYLSGTQRKMLTRLNEFLFKIKNQKIKNDE